ncbi:MAG TPA: S-adenosylmethionine:tRNA ribosyltransferase-isomerase, partial [Gemmatimonadales bacterium]
MTPDQGFTLSDFDYELPPALIAQSPNEERSASRLLVVRRTGRLVGGPTGFEDLIFGDLLGLIPAGDLLVLNTSRVRHARLLGTRPSGAPAEVLL